MYKRYRRQSTRRFVDDSWQPYSHLGDIFVAEPKRSDSLHEVA